MNITKVQLTLDNGTLLMLETNNIEDFKDKFRFGDESTVLTATDGSTFRVNAITSYKIVGTK